MNLDCRCRAQAFLGTGVPLYADITLAIEIATGLALVLGMVLRQRYVRLYMCCALLAQSVCER